MDKLVTDKPKDNFSFVLNYVFSRDGQAYIRTDEDGNGVLLTQWMKAQCIAHGCTELEDVNVEDIDEIISDCAFDFDICPLFVLYKCACQAVHLRDRLRLYENTDTFPSDIEHLKDKAHHVKTENDCLAEYVRITRPNIENSPSYHWWRIGKRACNSLHGIVEKIAACFVDIDTQELIEGFNGDSEGAANNTK